MSAAFRHVTKSYYWPGTIEFAEMHVCYYQLAVDKLQREVEVETSFNNKFLTSKILFKLLSETVQEFFFLKQVTNQFELGEELATQLIPAVPGDQINIISTPARYATQFATCCCSPLHGSTNHFKSELVSKDCRR